MLAVKALVAAVLAGCSMAFMSGLGSSSRYGLSRLMSQRSPLNLIARRLAMSTAESPVDSRTSPVTVNVDEESLFGFDLPTNENSPFLLKTRHTASHVMAMAVQKLHKEAQVTIGPWIDNGFYYDFFIPEKQLAEADLKMIKKEMDKIIKADLPLRREEVTREEAR